ncbi:MAG: hypothetical protein M1832_003980 [Thelocarpon impressellum]|nr:MAG: hypothetical protein M1832_003980 [Thelocarpon impressellum]
MATSRLRHTFRYPAENTSDDEDLPEALDEEEQDRLITALRAENESRNGLYTRVLLALALLCALPYVPALLHSLLIAVLALTSLACTAYTLAFMPSSASAPPFATAAAAAAYASPVERWLPVLNAILCGLVALTSSVRGSGGRGGEGGAWMAFVPGVLYAAVLLARREMRAVDVGKALEGLRYGYKGA